MGTPMSPRCKSALHRRHGNERGVLWRAKSQKLAMPSQCQHRAHLHALTIDVLCIDDGDERGVGRVAEGAPWTGPRKAGRRVLDHVRTLDPRGQEALHLRRAAGNTACAGGDLAAGLHSPVNTYLQIAVPQTHPRHIPQATSAFTRQ